MAGQKVINYNRTAYFQALPVEVAVTALIADLKGDSSQQHRITGVEFGVAMNAQADRTLILFTQLYGFLDYRGNVDAVNPTVVITEAQALGELFFQAFNMQQNQGFLSIDFANPIVINGDRRVTFISQLATSGLTAGNVNYTMTVRGSITQLSLEDQPKYGKYVIRG